MRQCSVVLGESRRHTRCWVLGCYDPHFLAPMSDQSPQLKKPRSGGAFFCHIQCVLALHRSRPARLPHRFAHGCLSRPFGGRGLRLARRRTLSTANLVAHDRRCAQRNRTHESGENSNHLRPPSCYPRIGTQTIARSTRVSSVGSHNAGSAPFQANHRMRGTFAPLCRSPDAHLLEAMICAD